MSNTKGSMLISNANAVGTELVNQLGGTGYKPVEWSDKINLLGINSVDAPYAIKSIQAGTYTGEERGAIQYSNCNAVGSMLNKKLNTNRGFKPVEWPSAIKVLKALAENTVSGDICNVSDGADRVPLKSWSVNIPANLSGKSTVVCTDAGKNLFDNTGLFPVSGSVTSYYFKQFDYNSNLIPQINLKAGVTYTLSLDITSSIEPFNFSVGCGNGGYSSDILNVYNKNNGRISITFTPTTAQLNNGDIFAFRCPRYQAQNTFDYSISNVQLEIGSTATTYEPYTAPTVNTVDLGRTVYGADVDVVGGTCKPINLLPNVASSKTQSDIIWTVNADGTVTLEGTSTARTYLYLHTYFKILPYDATITVNVEGLYDNGTSDVFVNIPYSDNGTTYSGNYGQCTWANPTKQINYTADKYIGFYIDCPAGTTTNQTVKITVSIGTTVHTYSPYFEPFTFDPITPTPETNTSVNFWNDTGSNTITYYQAPTALTRSTVSGSIASFSDADTRLTCVNAIATIPPSIAGVDTVQLVDVGETIFYPMDVEQGSISGSGYNSDSTTRIRTAERKAVTPSTQYKIKVNSEVQIYEVHEYTDLLGSATHLTVNASEYTFTTKSTTNYLRILFRYSNNATITPSAITELQVTDDVLYWKTYTANLPSTNYGGSVDFVSGDVVGDYSAPFTWTNGMSGVSVNANGVCYINKSDVITVNASNQTTLVGCICSDASFTSRTWAGLQNSTTNGCACVYGNGIAIRIEGYTTKEQYETYLTSNPLTFIYMLKDQINTSITGQAIIPKTGTNNCYNNVGGNTEITYFTNT